MATLDNKTPSTQATQAKSKVALLSVCSNTLLVIGKLIVGLLVGSVSIISEAIHSSMDLLASGIALFAVKTSDLPPDQEHPYGHGRVENISSAAEAILIFIAGCWIIYESIHKIIHPEPMQWIGLGVLIMLISSMFNLFVASRLFKIGHKTNSPALLGDAWHLLTDVWTSAAVMIALAIVWTGVHFLPQYDFHIVDPLAGILVSLIIIHTAYKLIRQAINELMDIRLPAEEEKLIQEHVQALKPITRGFHKLKTRSVGNRRYIEFHLKVDGNMSVSKAHNLSHQIQNSIEEHLKNCSITIHFEPCSNCSEQCIEHCVLNEQERKQIQKNEQKEK